MYMPKRKRHRKRGGGGGGEGHVGHVKTEEKQRVRREGHEVREGEEPANRKFQVWSSC